MKSRTAILALMTYIVLLCSCEREYRIDDPEKNKKEPGEITLTLLAPKKFNSEMTRSMTQDDEQSVDAVTVVVFYNNGNYRLHKTASGSKLTRENGFLKVVINLPSDDQSYDLLVLTNMEQNGFTDEDITTALNDTHGQGSATINTAWQRLWKVGLKLDKTGWKADGMSRFIMAGICLNKTLTPLTQNIGTIHLVRSLAKVEVGTNWNPVSNSWDGLANFRLEELYIYNANSQYTLYPKNDNWDNTGSDAGLHYSSVNAPTLWNFESTTGEGNYSIGKTEATALRYTVPTGDVSYERGIYIAEASNSAQTQDRPSLIIKGLYNGTSYYYKMDFATIENGRLDSYLPILRNHSYRFNIKSIQGPGYPTPDEAYNSKSMNITIDIVAWDESGMNDTSYDGQYQLTVNKSAFTFYKDADRTQTLSLFSDNPNGWRIVQKPDWVNVTPMSSSVTNEPVDISISCTLNDTGGDREGTFVISAGNLNKIIHIKQLTDAELTILLVPNILRFKKSPLVAKSIEITTYPAGMSYRLASTGSIAWSSFPANGTNTHLSFLPATNSSDPLQEIIDVVTISVIVEGKTASANLTVIQEKDDNFFDIRYWYEPFNYPFDGGNTYFFYTSDSPWKMGAAVTNPDGMVSGYPSGNQEVGDNVQFPFSLSRNTTWGIRTARFNIASDDINFPSGKQAVIEQDAAKPKMLLQSISNGGLLELKGAEKEISFTHNSDWKFTGDANYANVIASVSKGGNGTSVAYGNPTYDNNETIIFTPNVTVGAGSPQEGTTTSTRLTFTSWNHSPATPATQTLDVTTTVPAAFINPTVTPASGTNIPANGATITYKATSNAEWIAKADANPTIPNNIKTQPADSYLERTQTIAINAINWAVDRIITAYLSYKGETKSTIQYTQVGYKVTAVSLTQVTGLSPNYIIGSQGSATYNITGYFPANTPIRIVVNGSSPANVVSTSVVNMPATGSVNGTATASVNITVKANDAAMRADGIIASRTLQIQYYKDNVWIDSGKTIIQGGQPAPRVTWGPLNDGSGKWGYIVTYDTRYAGLYFKYGSVIGVFSSSTGTQDLSNAANANNTVFATGQIPHNLGLGSTIISWATIPFAGNAAVNIDQAYHTAANVKAGKGDPCRLVGINLDDIKNNDVTWLNADRKRFDNGVWRMPTNAENSSFFGSATAQTGWFAYSSPYTGGVPGFGFPSRDAGNFLPAAGHRNKDGNIVAQGTVGAYWSSSWISVSGADYPNQGYDLYFHAGGIENAKSYQSNGFAVRCVRQ